MASFDRAHAEHLFPSSIACSCGTRFDKATRQNGTVLQQFLRHRSIDLVSSTWPKKPHSAASISLHCFGCKSSIDINEFRHHLTYGACASLLSRSIRAYRKAIKSVDTSSMPTFECVECLETNDYREFDVSSMLEHTHESAPNAIVFQLYLACRECRLQVPLCNVAAHAAFWHGDLLNSRVNGDERTEVLVDLYVTKHGPDSEMVQATSKQPKRKRTKANERAERLFSQQRSEPDPATTSEYVPAYIPQNHDYTTADHHRQEESMTRSSIGSSNITEPFAAGVALAAEFVQATTNVTELGASQATDVEFGASRTTTNVTDIGASHSTAVEFGASHVDLPSGVTLSDLAGQSPDGVAFTHLGGAVGGNRQWTRVFACKPCQREFHSKVGLNSHRMRAHQAVRTHACDQCDSTFYDAEDLREHKRLQHSGQKKPWRCLKCHRDFSSKGSLKTHDETVHQRFRRYQYGQRRSFACDQCDRVMTRISDLKQHRLQEHLGKKLWQCDQCGKSYVRQPSLIAHRQTAHADAPSSSGHNLEEPESESAALKNEADVSMPANYNVVYKVDDGSDRTSTVE